MIQEYNRNLKMRDINKQELLGLGKQVYADLSIIYGVSL